ncbi:MAG: mechanosensitive ion channel family protein [Planctomycetes bacterium]|nr:mechanosensitive ion channel family protein [Planctomycetota bacterium]
MAQPLPLDLALWLQSAPSDTPGSVEFLQRSWLGNTYQEWITALCVAAAVTIALGLFKRFAQHRLALLAERTETDLDDLFIDLVRRTQRWFLFVIGVYVASHFLHKGAESARVERIEMFIERGLLLATLLQVGLWGRALVVYAIQRVVRGRDPQDPGRVMGSSILGLIGNILVWTTVVLLALQNVFKQDVTALITGLGVGGIAVALALQNVLGDLFASITILLDKPFVVGDAITLGEFVGTVEEIGIKTTRLRSVNGELIVVGNADLVNSRIRNFKRLSERRSVFTIGVTYSTPYADLDAIPKILQEIVEHTPNARFDRAHFRSFGDWALLFEVVYFCTRPEYNALMDVQQHINLEIKRRFEERGIDMAFPTQTVIHQQAGETPRLVPGRAPGR